MRFLSLLPILFFFGSCKKGLNTLSIERNPKEEVVCNLINKKEECPEFVGGIKEMYLYIGKNLKYQKENSLCICVNVNIQFDVLVDGKVDNARIFKSKGVCPLLEKELIKIFQNMPVWKPDKQNNILVKTNNIIVPFRITLEDE